jgi:hypothetical protein
MTRKTITINCDYCGSLFEKELRKIKEKKKLKGEDCKFFCSLKCSGLYKTEHLTSLVNCDNCKIQFSKKNSEIEKTTNNFCSHSCSSTFLNKLREPPSRETRNKTSKSLGGSGLIDKKCKYCNNVFECTKATDKEFCSKSCAGLYSKRFQWAGKFGTPESILDLAKRTVSKIFKRMKVGCSNCGWSEGTCDLHHIRGRKIENANDHNNLTLLCPNCHRLAHEKKIPIEKIKTLEQHIGDIWKTFYYG